MWVCLSVYGRNYGIPRECDFCLVTFHVFGGMSYPEIDFPIKWAFPKKRSFGGRYLRWGRGFGGR